VLGLVEISDRKQQDQVDKSHKVSGGIWHFRGKGNSIDFHSCVGDKRIDPLIFISPPRLL